MNSRTSTIILETISALLILAIVAVHCWSAILATR